MLRLPVRLSRVLEHALIDSIQLEIGRHGLRPEEVVIERLVTVDPLLRIQSQQLVD